MRGGNLTSIGGRVELGSVHNGVVGITKDQTLSYDPNLKFGQILISEESSIDVSGRGRVEFQIQGEEIKVRDASIIVGEIKGDEGGGASILKASKSIIIEGRIPFENNITSSFNVSLFSDKLEAGEALNINKTNSAIILITYGKGNVGELTVETESLTLDPGAFISTTTLGQGNGGNLTVFAKDIEMNGGDFFGGLVSASVNQGNGGNLTVKAAESLTLQGGAQISTSTVSQGHAGNLTVSARDILSGDSSGFTSETLGQGNGGNITVKAAESLTLQDGVWISTTTYGEGNAGNLTVFARDIEIIGKSPDGEYFSSLTAEAKKRINRSSRNHNHQHRNPQPPERSRNYSHLCYPTSCR